MTLKKWVVDYKNHILFIISLLISFGIYWNYLMGHFAAESYAVSLGYQNYAIHAHLVDGRLFSFLLLTLAGSINLPILLFMSLSEFLAIIVATIAVCALKNTVCKILEITKIQEEVIVWLISYSVIFNFMMIEIMYFPEACIMVASILFYILAARLFVNKKYGYSFILLVLGVFCYQGTIGFFVVCTFLLLMIKDRKIGKKFLIDMCKVLLISSIAAGLNLLFIKLVSTGFNLKQNKIIEFNIGVIIENIKRICISIFPILQKNCGLFPKNLLLILIEIILVFTLMLSYKEKKDKILNLLAIMLITIGSSFCVFVLQSSSLYTGRAHFCIGSLIGVLFLYLYSMTNIKNEKRWLVIFLLIVIVYVIINGINTISMVTQHKIVNQLEKEECAKIENIIKEHERKNNIKVNKIVPILIFNQEERGYFQNISRKAIITYNNVRHYYGYTGIIQYYLKRNFQGIQLNKESDKKYKEYITENKLDYGEIICIEDVLYCPQYLT